MTVRAPKTALGGALLTAVVLVGYRELVSNVGRLREAEDVNNIPWLHFIVSSLRDGTIPLWNPHVLGGYAMTTPGSWHQGMYYPAVFLRTMLPLGVVDALQGVVHIVGGGVFVLLLCRRYRLSVLAATTAAAVYALSGHLWTQMIGGADWYIQSSAYLPALVYFAHRYVASRRLRDFLGCGAMAGLQMLGGHVQLAFYSLMALVVWFVLTAATKNPRAGLPTVIRASVLSVAAVAVVGAVLAAVAYVPFLADGQETFRTRYASLAFSTYGSLRPHELLGAWMYSWKPELFTGCAALLLALLGVVVSRRPERGAFLGVSLLGLLLALGKYGPLHYVLYGLVPGFSAFRSPERALVLYAFGVAMLAGFGTDALRVYATAERAEQRRYWRVVAATIAATIGFAVVGSAAALVEAGLPALREALAVRIRLAAGVETVDVAQTLYTALEGKLDPIASILSDILTKARGTMIPLGFLLAIALLLLIAWLRPARIRLIQLGILLLVVAEAAQFNSTLTQRGIRYFDFETKYGRGREIVQALRADPALHRVAVDATQRILIPNEGMIHGLDEVMGATANVPLRYHDYLLRLVEEDRVTVSPHGGSRRVPDFPFYSSAYGYLVQNFDSPFLDLLNVKYVVTTRDLNPDKFRRVLTSNGTHLFMNTTAFPRAWLAETGIVAPEDGALVAAMRKRPDFRHTVLLSSAPPAPPVGTSPAGAGAPRVTISTYEPTAISLRAETPAPAFLVLSETHHPGWRAFVNGKEAPVLRANYLFRAISLGSGSHDVTLVFDPPLVRTSRAVSVLAWCVLLVFLIVDAVRRAAFRTREVAM